ncbi:MAG: AbrB/MazE/SpoVT family DNA-binding domain-containing protein [Spirochaetia bacterium]|nr:AbrB/MazE/SpoVT family DNA-binding domain-containing protein [Spirochaetia bacterium]
MEKIIEDSYKVQLPKEFCENLGFEIGSHVELSIDNNSIKIEAVELPLLPHVAMIKIVNSLLCKDLEFVVYDLKIKQYTNILLAKDDNDITVETLTPKEWLNSENFAFKEYLEWNKNFLVFPINIFNSKKSEDELVGFIMYKKEKDFALNNMNIAYILGVLSII